MRIVLYGDAEYSRWPPIREVLATLGHRDVVVTDGRRGISTKVEFLLTTMRRTRRPEQEIQTGEWPKKDGDAVVEQTAHLMVMVGERPAAAVVFSERQDDRVDLMTAKFEEHALEVFDWESFVEGRMA